MSGAPSSYVSQEWSVHAQLTISHRRPDAATPLATTPRDDNGGVQMEYTWSTLPAPPFPRPCYGFQRGNITFTTRPPSAATGQGMQDSGYSERMSPGCYGSLPTQKRTTTPQPYNRRCRSTCSITLSEVPDEDSNDGHVLVNRSHSLNTPRDQRGPGRQLSPVHDSLRDQGRPWMDVAAARDNLHTPRDQRGPGRQLSPVHDSLRDQGRPRADVAAARDNLNTPGEQRGPWSESCEVCDGDRSPSALRRGTHYTTHFCTRVPDKCQVKHASQDAASQTTDAAPPPLDAAAQKCQVVPARRAVAYDTRRKTDSALLQVPVLDLPSVVDSAAAEKPGKPRLSRSPARVAGKSPLLRKSPSRSPESVKTPPVAGHKPRTVHIDVYCTGSDASDDSSTASDSSSESDADGESWTSPQTVFESEQVRVVHTRAHKDSVPQALRPRDKPTEPPAKQPLDKLNVSGSARQQLRPLGKVNAAATVQQQRRETAAEIADRGRSESFKYASLRDEKSSRGYDSDDGLSSQYPSRLSSYTSVRDSSVTSIDPCSSAISCSSYAFTDDCESTSCKDTATDVDTLSLIAASQLSLAASDSFEYADSCDRLRISERERAWAAARGEAEESKTWRSPQAERKHMLQQQKFREFLARHLDKSAFPLWTTTGQETDDSEEDDDDDDDGDETGDAWSFGGGGESSTKVGALKREDTVRRACSPPMILQATRDTGEETSDVIAAHLTLTPATGEVVYRKATQKQPPCRAASPTPDKIESGLASPFTPRMGVRTDQLSKAEKFGTIVGAFRKPGHHVGPSKNPECSCAHCRTYYDKIGYRSRTRSLDVSAEAAGNWKVELQEQIARRGIDVANEPRGKGAAADVKLDDGAQSAVCEDEWDDCAAV